MSFLFSLLFICSFIIIFELIFKKDIIFRVTVVFFTVIILIIFIVIIATKDTELDRIKKLEQLKLKETLIFAPYRVTWFQSKIEWILELCEDEFL